MAISSYERVCKILETSEDKREVLGVIRALIPDTVETNLLINALKCNSICDAEIRLEAALKVDIANPIFAIGALALRIEDIFECAENTGLLKKVFDKYPTTYGAYVALRVVDADMIEVMYTSSDSATKKAAVGNCNARPEFLTKVIQECTDETIKDIAKKTLAVVNVKLATDPDVIEQMYANGPYEVKFAAVSNTQAKREWLEKIVSNNETFKSIAEVAAETIKKISST